MSVQKECKHCGKAFTTPNRRSETVKFCSAKCKYEAGWLLLECPVCGSNFRRKKSDTSRSNRLFCSHECFHRASIGQPNPGRPKSKVSVVCETCASTFLVIASRQSSARFCSNKCKSENPKYKAEQSELQQGEKGWRWNGGTYQFKSGYVRHKRNILGTQEIIFSHRKVIFDALLKAEPNHPFLIEIDGKKRLDPEIEVHHIDRDRSHNKLANLLAVTKHAHAQIHHRNRKPLPNECWPRNPAKW